MSSAGHPRTLAGRYRLDEVIGRGGMSTVYRGTDLALDRVVAVKVALDPLAEENPVYVARFKREARAAAALSHPGAVTVYDAGADGATRFIVMEFVEGRSLADILRDEGPLEPARAAYIAEQVADTLAAAHAAGIVHRDVKPGNIMVEEGGAPGPDGEHGAPGQRGAGAQPRVKVLDFGIARTAGAVTLTQTASVLGTAPYMAPEQAMGNPADARSDIYSLGCVLYEMLTGQPPFMGDVAAAVLHQHVRVEPRPPSALKANVPPALDALVLQMLAKKPEDRPQTADEVRDRLAAFRTQTAAASTTAPTAATAPLAPSAVPPAVETVAGLAAAAAEVPQVATVAQPATVPPEAAAATRRLPPPAPPHRSRRGLWAALAALSVLLVGAAVAFALSSSGGGSGGSAPPPKHVSTSSVTGTHNTTQATTHTPTTTSTTSPTSSTTQSTPSSTTTTTTSETATTNPPPGPGGAPPAPPGQEKKRKKK